MSRHMATAAGRRPPLAGILHAIRVLVVSIARERLGVCPATTEVIDAAFPWCWWTRWCGEERIELGERREQTRGSMPG